MEMAERDPRIMAELNAARARAGNQCETFEEALAPLGMVGATVKRTAKQNAAAATRQRMATLYYI